jgi:tRNA G18 (ribose-2'-O)-methylase SpoU
MKTLTDSNDPSFDPIRKIRGDHPDYLMIEGENAIEHTLKYGVQIHTLFFDNDILEKIPETQKITNKYFANRKLLKEVMGFNFHRHAVGLADRIPYHQLDPTEGPFLILNSLTSPENVGTLIRTAKAFGIKSILFDRESCSPYVRRCLRVSIGHTFGLHITRSDSLAQEIGLLKKNNVQVIALETAPNACTLTDTVMGNKTALILGSEGHGIEKNLLELCDQITQIEMPHNIGSLNVAQSGAIALYQLSQNLY